MGQTGATPGLKMRGGTFYARFRTPKRYHPIEPRAFVEKALGTACPKEAAKRVVVFRAGLELEWERGLETREMSDRLAAWPPTTEREFHEATKHLLRSWDLVYRTVDGIAAGNLDDLQKRLDVVEQLGATSDAVPVVLGALDIPKTLVSELPAEYERIEADRFAPLNSDQLRMARNRMKRAATTFIEVRGDKPIAEIDEKDALDVKAHWKARRDKREVQTDYANKHLGVLAKMIDAHWEDVQAPQAQRLNYFSGMKLKKQRHNPSDSICGKLALPMPWIMDVLLDDTSMAGLNAEATAIARICAETGARQREIYDTPPGDIHLDHPIPHLMIDVVVEGEEKRQIKNSASRRPIVLLGVALREMRKFPGGFPRYRAKGSYSATVNAYLNKRGLFPEPGPSGNSFSIGGLRHTYENRMDAANIAARTLHNKWRAYMMGHSIAVLQERYPYGSQPDLELRALFQEMVSLPVPRWQPRPLAILDDLVEDHLKRHGLNTR